MTRDPAAPDGAAVTGGTEQAIRDAITAGWAWSVFGKISSDGPIAWGIEPSEDAAVRRAEYAMTRKPGAAFGGIAGAGTEKVCQRTTTGALLWRQVTAG